MEQNCETGHMDWKLEPRKVTWSWTVHLTT